MLTNRVVASAKAAVIPATTTAEPHLLTGRIRFLHPGLWSWANVLAQGTWQNLKDTKPTWLDVRGTSSTVSGTFLNLFVTIVDPGTGVDLIPPQRVALGLDIQVNTWLDISMLFANAVDIPATAEIRLVHGSTVKEFGIDWYLDEFGITPGAQRASHSTLYWFDGDSSLPSNPTEMALGAGWLPASEDAVIRWAGIGVPVRTNRAPNPGRRAPARRGGPRFGGSARARRGPTRSVPGRADRRGPVSPLPVARPGPPQRPTTRIAATSSTRPRRRTTRRHRATRWPSRSGSGILRPRPRPPGCGCSTTARSSRPGPRRSAAPSMVSISPSRRTPGPGRASSPRSRPAATL